MSANGSVGDSAKSEQHSAYQGVLEKYLKWLDDEPLKARCITAAIIGACGALLGARMPPKSRRKTASIDWIEVVSFALHGGLVAGPLSHYL